MPLARSAELGRAFCRPDYNINLSQEMEAELMVITNILEAKATLSNLLSKC
jgi:hypothetical protein